MRKNKGDKQRQKQERYNMRETRKLHIERTFARKKTTEKRERENKRNKQRVDKRQGTRKRKRERLRPNIEREKE